MSSPVPSSHRSANWWTSRVSLAAILGVLSLTSSGKTDPEHKKSVILPNAKLMGCKSSDCPQILPNSSAGPTVYPWQISFDFSDGRVIGLTALYDQPTTIDDVTAAINESYGKWVFAPGSSDQIRLWRVEPEKFVMQLCVNDDGMVQLIYLVFDARHPVSDPVRKKFLDRLDATHPDAFARQRVVESMTPQSQ